MKILVTGFDPFGDELINPAIEAVKRLPNEIDGVEIIKLEIPTKFNVSAQVVRQAIKQHQPDYVLNIGQAGGRFALTPERIAINLDDGRIADNAGFQPVDCPIHEDGQTAYFTQLPVKSMTLAIREAGLPAEVSNSAGTYVCNHIMYQVQYMREKEFPQIKAGFMHIPFLPEQVTDCPGTPSLSLSDDIKGIKIALSTIIERNGKPDIATVEGKIH